MSCDKVCLIHFNDAGGFKIDLTTPITTYRYVENWYYLVMFGFLVLAFLLAKRGGIIKFGLIFYGIGVVLNFLWEANMIIQGVRVYQSGFEFAVQLLFHVLTEFGPFTIIIVLIAEKLRLVDLDKYRDENVAV